MKIGDISGCLEVIGTPEEAMHDILVIKQEWAQYQWHEYSNGTKTIEKASFKTFFQLDSVEKELFDNRQKAPESFIEKYLKRIDLLGHRAPMYLYHKKKPDSLPSFLNAFSNSNLFKVKCNTCGKTYLIDAESFNCVKWRNCRGAQCIATTIPQQSSNTSESLYEWDSNSTELLKIESLLPEVEEISNPPLVL